MRGAATRGDGPAALVDAVRRAPRPRARHEGGPLLADYAFAEPDQGGLRGSRPRSSPGTRPRCGSRPGRGFAARAYAGWRPAPVIAEGTTEYVVARPARHRSAALRAGGFRAMLNSVPAPQAGDRAAAGPRRRRAGPAVPADVQAGLGPARRGRRGRRVPAGGRGPRDRRGARPSRLEAGPLLLTDWLPPWGGWDDAVCLVLRRRRPRPLDRSTRIVREPREIPTAEFGHARRGPCRGAPTSPPGGSRRRCAASRPA